MKRKLMSRWNRFADWFDTKKISAIAVLVFLVSMLPVWYLSFYARPAGDDFGYAAGSHQAWIRTHSLVEVFRAGIETTKHMCKAWNGDWFTVFMFTWMPEVFVPYSFWIVPILMTLAVTGTTIFFFQELLVERIGFKWYESLMIAAFILIAFYQFIPSTAIGMYWYVGTVHYMFPHTIALLLLVFLSKYERTGKKRYVVYSFLGTIMIGGSSYFSSLLVFMIYIVVIVLCVKRSPKIMLIGIPLLSGVIALFFQITAPGNAARGGSGFGFSISLIIETIGESLIQGGVRIGEYLTGKPFVFVSFIVIAALAWECMITLKCRIVFKCPAAFVVFMYMLYAAMFAPEIYVSVEVSLGPATMQYITFLLTFTAAIIYIEGWLAQYLEKKRSAGVMLKPEKYRKNVLLPVLGISILAVLVGKGMLKESVFVRSCEYVASGQANDFKRQIESQMEILLDDTIKEAYLCPINDVQGPLMHMPVTEDPNAFTNRVVAEFYGKELVIMKQNQ
ncbi:MAG: hypothetical protein HFG28_10060 [Eubacterium sp.]|jgi:hypothetical protein|nr:hypothetical protein [Eubacterium sp.]